MPSKPVPNFKVADPILCEQIQVGDRVRSYDFAHHDDCYIEGTVEEITAPIEGCPRYRISGMYRMFDGKETLPGGKEIFPPINGTPRSGGGYCNGVRKVAS